MPGDYLFPKRLFVKGEPLETTEINAALLPPSERLNGHLGPHNLRAPLSPGVLAEADTFCKTKQVFVDVDSLLVAASSSPVVNAPGSFRLFQETAWQRITGPSNAKEMRVEVKTGTSALVITAHAAHCYQGNEDGEHAVWKLAIPWRTGTDYEDQYDENNIDSMTILLDGTGITVSINLPPPGTSGGMAKIVKQVALRIADGGRTHVDYLSYGYSAWADGKTVLFRRAAVGPVAGGTFQAVGLLAHSPVMTEEVVGLAPSLTAGNFSALSSHDTTLSIDAVTYFPAQIQYALRVDGVVINETITGRFDNEQRAFAPARIVEPVTTTSTGVMVGRFRELPDAVNIPMYAVRLTATVDVGPGDHQVELVVRRVPCGRNREFVLLPPELGAPGSVSLQPLNNSVVIYGRQLSVTDVPTNPVGSVLFGEVVTVEAYESEEVVSEESLYRQRLLPVAAALNEVKSFQVARGAVNGDHLSDYSSVISFGSYAFTSGGTATIRSDINPYEWPVSPANGASFAYNYLLYTNTTWFQLINAKIVRPIAGLVVSPLNCVITVEANVFFDRLRPRYTGAKPASFEKELHLSAVALCVGLQSGGIWYLWRPSIVWANSNNYFAQQPSRGSVTPLALEHLSDYEDAGGADYVDVPVTATFAMSGFDEQRPGVPAGLLVTIDEVAVFASAAHMTSTARIYAEARVKRASINVVAMKS